MMENGMDSMKHRTLIVFVAAIAGLAMLALLGVLRFSSGHAPPALTPAPRTAVIGPTKVQPQIVGAWGNMVVLAPDGSLWGWGESRNGELGIRSTKLVTIPRQ